ncbi:hypothetical protein BJY01DRAFT_253886 [Aspergillus pseudoustus]|uniref:Uncharacterized protein n=1 Tax=Aspergillus pseudoustus TaxID=1810923 RepID=A0ABR4IX33_9EURO
MSEPSSPEISPTVSSNVTEEALSQTTRRRDTSPSTFTLAPKHESTRDIGLFVGIGHDQDSHGRDWTLLFMYPGYTRCDYYRSTLIPEPPFEPGRSEITDEYPYARQRLENMSADVVDLMQHFQGWAPVGTIGEEHWERFWAAWVATKPGPSQWFIGRFLSELAGEALIERREAEEIFECAVYSEAEVALWGGEGEFVADVEWIEEMERDQDERLIDEMNEAIEREGRERRDREREAALMVEA